MTALTRCLELYPHESPQEVSKRAQGLKAAREALFIELAHVRRESAAPPAKIFKSEHVEIFGQVLRKKLKGATSPFAKSYLNISVDKIINHKNQATIKGGVWR